MKAILMREFRSFYTSLIGYIFSAFIILFAGIYTSSLCLKGMSANFEYVLGNMSFIYLIAVPILTMRSIAEERRQKTDKLLYSLPVSMTGVVMGKYFALLAALFIPTAVVGLYPLILKPFGDINLLASYGALFGFFLLGASLIAIGLFISSLTESQIVAVTGCFALILLNYFIGALASYFSYSQNANFITVTVIIIGIAALIWLFTKNSVLAVLFGAVFEVILSVIKIVNGDLLYGLMPKIMDKISLFERFYNFPNGVFDITAVVYFIAVSALFLFFTVQVMEKRRWN